MEIQCDKSKEVQMVISFPVGEMVLSAEQLHTFALNVKQALESHRLNGALSAHLQSEAEIDNDPYNVISIGKVAIKSTINTSKPVIIDNTITLNNYEDRALSPTDNLVQATIHSDDYSFEIKLDATNYFEHHAKKGNLAEIVTELAEIHWGGDQQSDEIAEYFNSSTLVNEDVKGMFDYIATKSDCGFECHVDEDSLRKWLKEFHPKMEEDLAESFEG